MRRPTLLGFWNLFPFEMRALVARESYFGRKSCTSYRSRRARTVAGSALARRWKLLGARWEMRCSNVDAVHLDAGAPRCNVHKVSLSLMSLLQSR